VSAARPAIDRFFEKVEKTATCWTWTASKDPNDYGQFGSTKAHRWAYEHFVGPIPAGFDLDHACRRPACVNPAHLEPVTHRVNVLRGISPMAINARKIICKNGHPFDAENTYRDAQGGRTCRKCRMGHLRRWRDRHPDDARRLDRESKRQWRASRKSTAA
jgi:HNH endonuclease